MKHCIILRLAALALAAALGLAPGQAQYLPNAGGRAARSGKNLPPVALPALQALTIAGTAGGFDGGTTGQIIRSGAAAGSHVGYLTSVDGAAISIDAQSVPNLVQVSGNRIVAGSGAASALPCGGSASVTYRASKAGYQDLVQTVTYSVKPVLSYPLAFAPYVGTWGDSISQGGASASLDGKSLRMGSGSGEGEIANVAARFPRIVHDVVWNAANTNAYSGNPPPYLGGANISYSGATIANWSEQLDWAIASGFDIVHVAIGINSIAGDPQTNVDAIITTLDAYHAAAPSSTVVLGTVRPTSAALITSRNTANVVSMNAKLAFAASGRSAWLKLSDVFTAMADNPWASSFMPVTFTANPASGQTFQIYGTTLTWGTDIAVGGTLAASLTNLAAYLNANTATLFTNAVVAGTTVNLTTHGTNALLTLAKQTTAAISGAPVATQAAANTTALDASFQVPGSNVLSGIAQNDGLHPKAIGIAKAAGPLVSTFSALVQGSVANPYLARGASLAALTSTVKFMSGTTAAMTAANGVSGALPAGWAAFASASQGSTTVVSTEANAETGGKSTVFDVTLAGSGLNENIGFRPSLINFAATDLAGQYGQALVELEVDGDLAWSTASVNLLPNNNGNAYAEAGYASIAGDGTLGSRRIWLATMPGLFPANMTASGFTVMLKYNPSLGAGRTLRAKVRQVDFRVIPNPTTQRQAGL